MKWFLTLASVAALIAAMTFGYLGHMDLLIAGLFASLALLVTANLDAVAEFKASTGGIEARTREVVNRAEGAIAELRILALHAAEVSLSLAMRQGRWGGFSDEDLDRLKSSVMENLERLGIPSEQRALVFRDWHRIVEFDYVHHILGGNRIPDNASAEQMTEWKSMRDGGFAKFPSPDELDCFFRKTGYWNSSLGECIEDYRYYIRERQHRRLDAWRDRMHWGHLKKDV